MITNIEKQKHIENQKHKNYIYIHNLDGYYDEESILKNENEQILGSICYFDKKNKTIDITSNIIKDSITELNTIPKPICIKQQLKNGLYYKYVNNCFTKSSIEISAYDVSKKYISELSEIIFMINNTYNPKMNMLYKDYIKQNKLYVIIGVIYAKEGTIKKFNKKDDLYTYYNSNNVVLGILLMDSNMNIYKSGESFFDFEE